VVLSESLSAARKRWPAEAIANSQELRTVVSEYEGLIRTITRSGGYGNVVLAHCLRRLDQVLLMQYVVSFPSEHEAVSDILRGDRVSLVDSRAMLAMLSEEVPVDPPSGGWRLSQRKEDWDLIFRTFETSFRGQTVSGLFGTPAVSKLLKERDVSGLMTRLLPCETIERVSLPGLLEFLKRGGRFEDFGAMSNNARWFDRLMDGDDANWPNGGPTLRRFQFPVMGINMLRLGLIAEIVDNFQPHVRKPIPFAAAVVE